MIFSKLYEKESEFLEGPLTEIEVLAFPKKMKMIKDVDQMVIRVNSLNYSTMNEEHILLELITTQRGNELLRTQQTGDYYMHT